MNQEIKILMIDDDEDDFIIARDIISEITNHEYSIEWAPDYGNGLKKVLSQFHHVYLVDYDLGKNNGLELISEAKSRGCEAPFILLTGQNDSEIDKKALQAGASDFLAKGSIGPRQIETSIRYSIEQARILKELRTLNMHLEKRVKERTLILEDTVAKLNKTKKELSEALTKERELNELKSRFVTMASHEFRTPLATILSSLTLVSKYGEQNEKEKQNRHISRIKSSVNHLTDLLNDVLSLSKLEEGKISVNPESFDLKVLVEEAVQDMQIIARANQKITYVHFGENEAITDKKIFRHMLINLVSNAMKFSSEEKPIDVKTEIANSHISLIVQDKGIGISDEDQKHLFERFFRGQNATNIQGTGLGLNIVSKYVEILGGTIDFKSILGYGTSFCITLPNNTVLSR